MKADIPASLQDSLRAVSEDELTLCDREPIHIPGSIQPHGMVQQCLDNLVEVTPVK